jgi:hypothetical protein
MGKQHQGTYSVDAESKTEGRTASGSDRVKAQQKKSVELNLKR